VEWRERGGRRSRRKEGKGCTKTKTRVRSGPRKKSTTKISIFSRIGELSGEKSPLEKKEVGSVGAPRGNLRTFPSSGGRGGVRRRGARLR